MPSPKPDATNRMPWPATIAAVGVTLAAVVGGTLAINALSNDSPPAPPAAAPTPANPAPTPSAQNTGTPQPQPPAPVTNPDEDAKLSNCRIVDGHAAADLTITNGTPEPASYTVQVEYLDGAGVRFAEGIAMANHLQPGKAAVQTVYGTAMAKGPATCRIIKTQRY